jgi:hypothetical protein
MIDKISIFYISKTLLLKNFIISLILSDLSLILAKFFFSINILKNKLIENKILFFYNKADFFKYSEKKINNNKRLNKIQIDQIKILLQKLIKIILVNIPKYIRENSDFNFLLISFGLKVESIHSNFLKFWGKIVLCKVIECIIIINKEKKIFYQNFLLVNYFIFYFLRKNINYIYLNQEFLYFIKISFFSLLWNIKNIYKNYLDIIDDRHLIKQNNNLVLLKWIFKKKKTSFYSADRILIRRFFVLHLIFKKLFNKNAFYINYYIWIFYNLFIQIFSEKFLFSELSVLTFNKLLLIKKKIFENKNSNFYFRINKFFCVRYMILNYNKLQYICELEVNYHRKILKWNIFYILLGLDQFDLNEKVFRSFICKIFTTSNIVTIVRQDFLKNKRKKKIIKEIIYFFDFIKKIQPLSCSIFIFSKVIFKDLCLIPIFLKKKCSVIFFNFIKLNTKELFNKRCIINFFYLNFIPNIFKIINLYSKKHTKLFYNIHKRYLLNINSNQDIFFKIFAWNFIQIKLINFSNSIYINPALISVYFFLLFINCNSFINYLYFRLNFFFYITISYLFRNTKILENKIMIIPICKIIFLIFLKIVNIIFFNIQTLNLKIKGVVLIFYKIKHIVNSIFFDANLEFKFLQFFFYIILKILLNLYRLNIYSLNIHNNISFLDLEKVKWKKPLFLLNIIKNFTRFFKKKAGSVSNTIKAIFIFYFRCIMLNYTKFLKKNLNNLTNLGYIKTQVHGLYGHILTRTKRFPKRFPKKFLNSFLLLDAIFFKEKNNLFLENKSNKIKQNEINNIIKLITYNLPSKSCVFEILKIRNMLNYSSKDSIKLTFNPKKKRLLDLFFW